ncbi:helix-turn-helix domain-containing protein [Luteolibacter arcticus]|uniref:helix-turn-helix domain-containing protein n=1 Tax=Luteolibacter arcticus TaxID=1581411 RepID=UPI0031BB121E
MSQKELADQLGITAAHLCGIEKGNKKPSLELLSKYAEYFKLPLSSLIYFTEHADSAEGRRPISRKAIDMLDWIERATRI